MNQQELKRAFDDVCLAVMSNQEHKIQKEHVEPNVLLLFRLCRQLFRSTKNTKINDLILEIDMSLVCDCSLERTKPIWCFASNSFDIITLRLATILNMNVFDTDTSMDVIRKIQKLN